MARPFTTELTSRQKAVLDWVKGFIRRNGMPPTVREIGRAFGLSSSSVFDYLKALQRKGCLFRRRELGPRSLVLKDTGSGMRDAGSGLRGAIPLPAPRSPLPAACPHCEQVNVVGRIAAGKPILATEDDWGSVTVAKEALGIRHWALGFAPRRALPKPKAQSLMPEVYALLVQGDSMIDAGILDGDVALIRKQETADDGDIVVALIDDEATLKILRRQPPRFPGQADRVKLEPANRTMQPIYVDAERLKILGKLVSVQRRYK